MNPKLKQQLKAAYEAPKPERKQEFLQQIQKKTEREPSSLWFFNFFDKKWVWITSLSIVLLLVSVFLKVPTMGYDTQQEDCSHVWMCLQEECITKVTSCFVCYFLHFHQLR